MTRPGFAVGVSAVLGLAASQRREVTRQPVFGVGLALGAALIALSPALSVFALGRAEALVLDLGASAMLFFGAFIAATAVAAGVAERLGDGTATLVLTRPVGPLAFVVGGFLGAAAALLQAGLVLGLVLLLTARHGPQGLHLGVALPALVAAAGAVGWGTRATLVGRPFQPAALAGATALLPAAYLASLLLDPRAQPTAPAAIDGTALAAAVLATLASLAFAALGTCLASRLAPAGAAALTLVGFVLGSLVQAAAGAAAAAAAKVAAGAAPRRPRLAVARRHVARSARAWGPRWSSCRPRASSTPPCAWSGPAAPSCAPRPAPPCSSSRRARPPPAPWPSSCLTCSSTGSPTRLTPTRSCPSATSSVSPATPPSTRPARSASARGCSGAGSCLEV
ncbi:MAG: hypothetical protein KF878_31130 [Planctomycetes bacterium]|nr:hypothetical protein [Planctomycetota bacterium]